jgi:hypothetical protein
MGACLLEHDSMRSKVYGWLLPMAKQHTTTAVC